MSEQLRGWLDGLTPPLHFEIRDASLVYDPAALSHRLQKDGWNLFVTFAPAGADADSAATFSERLVRWGLDHVPAPIALSGWKFGFAPPQSSFERGFEVLSYADGVLTLRLSAEFYALKGAKPREGSCNPPADGSLPEGCYVQVERQLPFDVVVEARIAPE
jgi:hypothetical protein